MSNENAFALHLFQQSLPDQIERFQHLGIGQPVVDVVSFLPRRQHAPLLHHVEVLGQVPNGNPQPPSQIGNRHFLLTQDIQDFETSGVGKYFAHIGVAPVKLALYARGMLSLRHQVVLKYSRYFYNTANCMSSPSSNVASMDLGLEVPSIVR